MEEQNPLYLPLLPEIREAANLANKGISELKYLRKHDRYNFYRYVKLNFVRASDARSAIEQILAFRNIRKELGFNVSDEGVINIPVPQKRGLRLIRKSLISVVGLDPWNDKLDVEEIDNHVQVRYNDYNPEEYCLLVENIRNTSLAFLPLIPSLVASLKQFIATYTSIEIIRLSPMKFTSTGGASFSEGNATTLHHSLLALARLAVPLLLVRPPVHITITGTVKKLLVSVDGTAIKTSPTQTRGVVALALMKYDHWFTLEEFCNIAFSGSKADLQGDFDDAFKFLKFHEPFGWDPDSGLRRIKGAVIESLVDEVVLRTHLSQKTKQ